MTNKLKNEKSPYLKQHKDNPVNWLPWDKETLEKAKNEKKPIFLSIGYASCHWCHVMAHESFENNDTAKVMNEKFVNIKVDREERPDLDSIFQKSLGVLTGAQGGWPLSMFLDENAVPFTGGTYFPPKEMHGRPSFTQVLENVSKVYSENRDKIIAQVSQLQLVFKELNRKNAVLKQDLEPYAEKIIQYLDEQNGGFKGAPKFPQFYVFDSIFYFYKKNNDKKFLKPVENLLKNISSKGIYDQLGGGIARYTVDEKWIIPHFEKMLYDNALLVKLYLHLYQITGNSIFKNIIDKTLNFIENEMLDKNGGFYSSIDADTNNIEGEYFVWTKKELTNIFDNNDLNLICDFFGIKENGNFEGSNVLHLPINEKEFLEKHNIKSSKIETLIQKLIHERNKRTKPNLDTKILTSWNGLMLGAFAEAGVVLNNNHYTEVANINAKYIINI